VSENKNPRGRPRPPLCFFLDSIQPLPSPGPKSGQTQKALFSFSLVSVPGHTTQQQHDPTARKAVDPMFNAPDLPRSGKTIFMIPKTFKEVIDLGDGREISIETGKLAKQAHGSVVVQSGKCMLLCTVVSNYQPSDVDFLPLTVDYREKFAASGRYPGGFFKREARPSDGEVLTMRLVDRVLRPLFPKNYHCETQVMIQLMSHDEDVMPDAMAGLAASAAIQLS